MNKLQKIIATLCFLVAVLLGSAQAVNAQRFSVGTNAVEWAELGTINAEASMAVHQKLSIHAGAGINPRTFSKGDPEKQMENRSYDFWAGLRFWPWHVYSGWWVGGNFRYMLYNRGGVFNRKAEEGDAFQGGLFGGYSMMLSDQWNLDFGVGGWAGLKNYTLYDCPMCGMVIEKDKKFFIVPDVRIVLQFIF